MSTYLVGSYRRAFAQLTVIPTALAFADVGCLLLLFAAAESPPSLWSSGPRLHQQAIEVCMAQNLLQPNIPDAALICRRGGGSGCDQSCRSW